jgi:hypothetical protein
MHLGLEVAMQLVALHQMQALIAGRWFAMLPLEHVLPATQVQRQAKMGVQFLKQNAHILPAKQMEHASWLLNR